MNKIVLFSSIVGAALAATVSGASAQTQLWVSSNGSGNCSRVSPCGSFQTAHDSAAGPIQINCVDSGNYGGDLTIIKSTVINCLGVIANARSITVNAAQADKVRLSGINLNGASGAVGTGISFNGGGSLSIENCTISNFSGFGVSFYSPSTYAANLSITDSVIKNNDVGITNRYAGPQIVRMTVERTQVTGNTNGYVTNPVGNGTGTMASVFTDSVISNNSDYGFRHFHRSGIVRLSTTLDRSVVSGNGNIGIRSEGVESYFVLSGSTVIANGTGLSSASGGTILSYRNNSLLGNVADGAPTAFVSQN